MPADRSTTANRGSNTAEQCKPYVYSILHHNLKLATPKPQIAPACVDDLDYSAVPRRYSKLVEAAHKNKTQVSPSPDDWFAGCTTLAVPGSVRDRL